MTLHADEFNRIGQYLLIEKTALARADAALVFGNRSISDSLTSAVAHYYHQGFFPYIVVSGGNIVDPDEGRVNMVQTEAEYMAARLNGLGVPENKIICENQATNTQENVEFCRDIFNDHAALQNARSVMSFGNIIASRRFLMTLKAHWPEMLAMHVGVNGYDCPAFKWHTNHAFRDAVMDQYMRLAPYQANGWIKEIDLDALNQRILDLQ